MGSYTTANGSKATKPLTNYAAFLFPHNQTPRIGHFDLEKNQIIPLSFASGTPLTNLYEVIEIGEKAIKSDREPVSVENIKLLPPIFGRDILAVGKNYAEHAKEFNSSGYDSSDQTDMPTHPVIFTKRATSIIAHGDDIFPHPDFTETLDYEGEIGVIIGKSGFRITQENAWDHVWGFTIINDVTARERQRDHKQFYIGKSPDTFCPIGPIAVPKEHLSKVLQITTTVNGSQRQQATTDDLIFSIPDLITVMSSGQTLQVGDTLATGTPAGVGFGFNPKIWLQPGDEICVSVTGLGTLRNKVANKDSSNPTVDKVAISSHIPISNQNKTIGGVGLTNIGEKSLYYKHLGANNELDTTFFIHGLGGTCEYFGSLIDQLKTSQSLYLFDLEGHGLSPSSALSTLSISSFASDVHGIYQHSKLESTPGITLVAHSMGCLVALKFVIQHPNLVKNLVLMGPPPSPLPDAGSVASHARAALVREKGMLSVVDAVVTAGTSDYTKSTNPLAIIATRLSLLSQDPEGYAKACSALANTNQETLDLSAVKCRTLIITGSEDKVSPPEVCRKMKAKISTCEDVVVLSGVGHWHLFEEPTKVCSAIVQFLNVS